LSSGWTCPVESVAWCAWRQLSECHGRISARRWLCREAFRHSVGLRGGVQELFAADFVLETAEEFFLDVGALDLDDDLLVFFVVGGAVDGDYVRGEIFFFGFVVAERVASRIG